MKNIESTIDALKKSPIIPVIVLNVAEDILPLAEALLEGGLSVIEITLRTPAAISAIKLLNKQYPDMLTGAGTVISQELAEQAIDAGASFCLAPGLNPELVRYFQSKNVHFIPGVMTPSELEKGLSLDCSMFKFFPAEKSGGIEFLESISSPYESYGVSFCPTGGLTLDNMTDYLASPLVSNIGGTWLATRKQIAQKKWPVITKQVKEAVLKL